MVGNIPHPIAYGMLNVVCISHFISIVSAISAILFTPCYIATLIYCKFNQIHYKLVIFREDLPVLTCGSFPLRFTQCSMPEAHKNTQGNYSTMNLSKYL